MTTTWNRIDHSGFVEEKDNAANAPAIVDAARTKHKKLSKAISSFLTEGKI
jgi:hypothetical protein